MSGDPPLGGGGPAYASLVGYVRLARDQLQGVPIATVSVPKIREDLVDTLVAAVAEAQTVAKQGSAEAGKSVGGMSTKARWFQLLGYLAQVLDGVCRNVELSEINERLMRVEKVMNLTPTKPVPPR